MTRTIEFLKASGLDADGLDSEGMLARFDAEMTAGLTGRASSLAMIPAFIAPSCAASAGRRVAVLDAGGTNLRAALVAFDGQGRPQIVSSVKGTMPGTAGEIGAEAFYEELARFLEPMLADDVTRIGFCFSYPAEVTPSCDARLLYWTKQVKVPAVVGTLVGSGLAAHLARRGRQPQITVLNDTVATLLAGCAQEPDASSYVGFILGTGTNTAYLERASAIAKSPDALACGGVMTINIESGGFAHAPRSRFDEHFDATTQDPGHYPFEKMISGAYLGGLGLTVLRQAALEGFFSPLAAAALGTLRALSNKELDDFCADPAAAGSPFDVWPAPDRETAAALCRPIYRRAARLTAVNIAAAVLRSGEGRDPARPVCVNADGSTFYRTRAVPFEQLVRQDLDALLGARGIHCRVVRVDDAPMLGAAVAALR